MTKIFFNFLNTLKGIKSFPIILISSSCRGYSVVLFTWVLLYFATPGSRKVDKSLSSFVSRRVLVPDPLKTTFLPDFILKGALCCELRKKTNTTLLAGTRKAEVPKAKGTRRWSKTLKAMDFPRDGDLPLSPQ